VRVAARKPQVHTFDKSFEDARLYEAELDKFFGQSYEITKATRAEERKGIDRFFRHLASKVAYSVEYKTDHKTAETGNVFVEAMSVDTAGKLGWAYTSCAQVLVYFVPQLETAFRADMTAVKRALDNWSVYPERPAWNRSRSGEYYRTLGYLVPLGVFRKVCLMEHDVARPLDASGFGGVAACRHDLPAEICKLCNGTVRRLIGGAA
jgi:hypothetical protein